MYGPKATRPLTAFAAAIVVALAVPARALADAAPVAPQVTVIAVTGHTTPAVGVTAPDSALQLGTITTTLDALGDANLTGSGVRYERTFGQQTAGFAYFTGDDAASTVANLYGLDYLVRTDAGIVRFDAGNGRDGAFGGFGFAKTSPGVGYDLHVTHTGKNERVALSTSATIGAIETRFTVSGASPDAIDARRLDGGLGFAYRLSAGRTLDLKFSSALDGLDTSGRVALVFAQRMRSGGYSVSLTAKDARTNDGTTRTYENDFRLSRRIVPGLNATFGLGAATTSASDVANPLAGVSANAKAGFTYARSGMRFATTIDRTETRAVGGSVTPSSRVRYDVTFGPSKKIPLHVTATVSQRYGGATSQPLSSVEIKIGPNR